MRAPSDTSKIPFHSPSYSASPHQDPSSISSSVSAPSSPPSLFQTLLSLHLPYLDTSLKEKIQSFSLPQVLTLSEEEYLTQPELAYFVAKAAYYLTNFSLISQISEKINHPAIKALCLVNSEHQCDQTTLDLLQSLFHEAAERNHLLAVVDISTILTLYAESFGAYEIATRVIHRAQNLLETADLSDNSKQLLTILLMLNLIDIELSRLNLSSVEQILLSISGFSQPNPHLLALINLRKANFHLYQGKLLETIDVLLKSFVALTQINDTYHKARVTALLAKAYTLLSRYSKAISLLEDETFNSQHYTPNISYSLLSKLQLAETYFVSLQFTKAKETIHSCYSLIRDHHIVSPHMVVRLILLSSRLGLSSIAYELIDLITPHIYALEHKSLLQQARALLAGYTLNLGESLAILEDLVHQSDLPFLISLSIRLDYITVLTSVLLLSNDSSYERHIKDEIALLHKCVAKSNTIFVPQTYLFSARIFSSLQQTEQAMELINKALDFIYKHDVQYLGVAADDLLWMLKYENKKLQSWPVDILSKASFLVMHNQFAFSPHNVPIRARPIALLIVKSTGVPIYMKIFENIFLTEEESISAFLSVLHALGKDIWFEEKEELIKVIRHEDWVILMERVWPDTFVALFASKEDLEIREKLTNLITALNSFPELSSFSSRLPPDKKEIVELFVNTIWDIKYSSSSTQ